MTQSLKPSRAALRREQGFTIEQGSRWSRATNLSLSRLGGTNCESRIHSRPGASAILAMGVLCFALTLAARAQQPEPPEDPEDEKQFGLWLDQGISSAFSSNKSLEVEFHERFDENGSNCLRVFRPGWNRLSSLADPRYNALLSVPAFSRQSQRRIRKPSDTQHHTQQIQRPTPSQPPHAHRRPLSREPPRLCTPPVSPRRSNTPCLFAPPGVQSSIVNDGVLPRPRN